MYSRITLLYIWNFVNQLHLNLKYYIPNIDIILMILLREGAAFVWKKHTPKLYGKLKHLESEC